MADSALLFLAEVAFVSLSGVLAPGPMFAATIADGYKDPRAGVKVSVGHALIELPLIVAIFLGLDTVLRDDSVFIAIGLLGGLILLYLGFDMIRSRHRIVQEESGSRRGPLLSGVVLTAANPYWLLWWATIGAALIAGAVEFGLIMLPVFALVHISCDFAWYSAVGYTVNRSKSFWSKKWHTYLFVASGIIMLIFGIYFLASSVLKLF
ncbi:MAG: LysE family transporter [Methanomassiliicoccales archaeon]|jgi:threonine/homoserine/homoserine lactone efflux protein